MRKARYARSLERSLGLPDAPVDREYLERSLADIRSLLNGQIDFHDSMAKRSETIEHRLHRAEVFLFGATLVCCLLHIVSWIGYLHLRGPLLTFFCGFFPVLGASLAEIINQGEFRRIAQQSRSMAERLQVELEELQVLSNSLAQTAHKPEQWSADIANAATVSARIMVNEVLGWRVIFQDRPLKTTLPPSRNRQRREIRVHPSWTRPHPPHHMTPRSVAFFSEKGRSFAEQKATNTPSRITHLSRRLRHETSDLHLLRLSRAADGPATGGEYAARAGVRAGVVRDLRDQQRGHPPDAAAAAARQLGERVLLAAVAKSAELQRGLPRDHHQVPLESPSEAAVENTTPPVETMEGCRESTWAFAGARFATAAGVSIGQSQKRYWWKRLAGN